MSLLVARDEARGLSRLDRSRAGTFRVNVPGEPGEAGPCAMLELFRQIARQAKTPLGFENAPGCWSGTKSALPDSVGRVLQARTAREAFDEVAAFTETFAWREKDGVAVIRPISAWGEADSLLNARVDTFQLTNVSLEDALYRALDATKPRLPYARTRRSSSSGPFDVPMSVDFSGGTLWAALTAIVHAKGDAEWHVGYADGRAAILVSSFGRLGTSATAFIPVTRGSNRAARSAPAL